MSINNNKPESPADSLTLESARQRWQLFHRAIAHAKESNHASLVEGSLIESDPQSVDTDSSEPQLTVVR